MEPFFPRNEAGQFPWGYLWTITMPCDGCSRRFPLLGSMLLKHPNVRTGDLGQALAWSRGDTWSVEVITGIPTQEPTYSPSDRGDGKKRKGKAARCVFCHHVHSLETVKAKGFAGEYEDEPIVVAADTAVNGTNVCRVPDDERGAVARVDSMAARRSIPPFRTRPSQRATSTP